MSIAIGNILNKFTSSNACIDHLKECSARSFLLRFMEFLPTSMTKRNKLVTRVQYLR